MNENLDLNSYTSFTLPPGLLTGCGYITGEKNKFITESDGSFYSLMIATPGLEGEDFVVNVKGDLITIEIPESEFTCKETFKRQVTFPFTKDSISVSVENGVFSLVIKKPENYEYSIEVE